MNRGNRLLEALPDDVYAMLALSLHRVSLKRGEVLHKPGEVIRHLYFPINCLLSITLTLGGGRTVETGAVGNRELVGINAFMGGAETTQTEYIVQVPGDAYRIESTPLLEAFNADKRVRDVLLKYTQAMIAQLSQNTACNRVHDLNARYARWLLDVRDRVQSDVLKVTQQFTSEMLGVRRATVTVAAAPLRLGGIITVDRGSVTIHDVQALKDAACECHGVLLGEYDRLLGPAVAPHVTYAAPAQVQ